MGNTDERPQGWQDGGKIRALRKEAGHSLPQFAAQVGVNKATLSLIERDKRGAGINLLVRIARELGKPVDELLRDAA